MLSPFFYFQYDCNVVLYITQFNHYSLYELTSKFLTAFIVTSLATETVTLEQEQRT